MVSTLRRAIVLLLIFAASPVAFAQESPPIPNGAAIESEVEAFMAKERVPGVSLAIVMDGQHVWARGFGFADLENDIPVKPETVFRLASISKMLTATAALQLAEQGKLDLKAPIDAYCEHYPEKPWPITMHDLLCHQSGIRHYKGMETRSAKYYADIKSTLAQFKDEPLLFEPGTKYSYTTYGYGLVGCIIEDASGMSFTDYMQKHVFDPAGMETIQRDDPYKLIKGRAQGYRKPIDPKAPMLNSALVDVTNKVPGGGFCSTATDLAKFSIALMGGKLLKPESLELMWTPKPMKNGETVNAGFGAFTDKRGSQRVIFHTGGQPRVSTVLYMEPDRKFAVAIMTNLEGAPAAGLAKKIAGLTDSE